MIEYRCWTEVSLGAIGRNYRRLKESAGGATVACVVKADAYRHGAARVAAHLREEGACSFAVANTAEGALLRDSGLQSEILVLGEILSFEYDTLFAHRLVPVVHDQARLQALDRESAARGFVLPFHLKIDSGMGRLGSKAQSSALAAAIRAATHLRLEGLMSHLATTAAELTPQTREQLAAFDRITEELAAYGLAPPCRHVSATIPVVYGHEAAFATMVRPGLGLYGYPSSHLEPALAWKARVVMVKEIAEGEPVGYGARWRAARPSRLAVLACGYADGVPHRLESSAYVLVQGCQAPIRGAVSMDLISVDVTDCPPVIPGDAAILIGRDGEQALSAEHWAAWAGTIPYVILCGIGARVGRIYVP